MVCCLHSYSGSQEIKDTEDDRRSLAEYAAGTTQGIYDTLSSLEGSIDIADFGERLDCLLM